MSTFLNMPDVTDDDLKRAAMRTALARGTMPDKSQAPDPSQGIPSIPGTGVMPTIARPPNESQGQENRAVGKAQYGAELPQVTAQAGTPEYGQQKIAQLDYQKMHPWGADVSAQPGAWGKIGHVLAKVGNIAGNALIPNVMASIPGTQLNQSFERKEAQQEIGEGEKNQLEEAQAKGWAPMTETLPNGQQVIVPWRNAAQLAVQGEKGQQAQELQGVKGTQQQSLEKEKEGGAQTLQTQKDTASGQRTEEQIEGRADVASKKPGTDFDQFYKDFLEEHKLDDSAHSRLMARKEYAAAGQMPQQPQRQLMAVPQPDGSQKIIEATPGTIIPAGATTPSGASGGNNAFDKTLAENAAKDIATANGADFRFRSMQSSYPRAVKGDQQAMLNLLANHIGMTMGLQKGARITQALLDEAQKSTPWLKNVESKFDSNGYLSGVTLSKMQMDQMMDLAKDQRRNSWEQAGTSADQAGVRGKVKFPADVGLGGGSTTGGSGGGVPSFAEWKASQGK